MNEASETEGDVTNPTTGTPHKKHKLTLLEKLLGQQFEDPSVASGAAAVTSSEVVQTVINHYKGIPTISLRDKPLQWWKINKHIMPNLLWEQRGQLFFQRTWINMFFCMRTLI